MATRTRPWLPPSLGAGLLWIALSSCSAPPEPGESQTRVDDCLRGVNLDRLPALLLHRRKQDCLDLPPKRRQMLPVTLSEAEGQGFQHRLQLKVEDYRRRAAAGLVRRDAEALAVLTALRQIGAEYKLSLIHI